MILSEMKPPYTITEKILALISTIFSEIEAINASHLYKPTTDLFMVTT